MDIHKKKTEKKNVDPQLILMKRGKKKILGIAEKSDHEKSRVVKLISSTWKEKFYF